jgi:putative DNA methylase
MRQEAERRIGHLYPKVKITQQMVDDGRPDLQPYVGQELTVIAWIWARTVASPDPSLGGKHVPLVRSFWLSKKKGKEAYVRPVISLSSGEYEFRVCAGKPPEDFDPSLGTVTRHGARCLLSGATLAFSYIRAEGKDGRISRRLMAIVC